LHWADNRAARAIGVPGTAYRPRDAWAPLDPACRYLRLPVAFLPVDARGRRPSGAVNPFWVGVYDSLYTRVGDYLVTDDRTYFIRSQDRLQPNICVETNQAVSFSRPVAPSGGAGAYSGITSGTDMPLTGEWPASVLAAPSSGRGYADLPTDVAGARWTVLMPQIPTVTLRILDRMAFGSDQSGIIEMAEPNRFGWRLIVRSTST
jgi:hypothetical protein